MRIAEEELEEEKQEREGAESVLRWHLIGQDQAWELEKTRELGGGGGNTRTRSKAS